MLKRNVETIAGYEFKWWLWLSLGTALIWTVGLSL